MFSTKTLSSVCAVGALCALLFSSQPDSSANGFEAKRRQLIRTATDELHVEHARLPSPSKTTSSLSRAHAHPHGDKICASGCALSHHPTQMLLKSKFLGLVSQLSDADGSSVASRQKAIDSLLYYGPQTKERLRLTSGLGITAADRSLLDRELKRDFVYVEFRLTSRAGRVLASLPRTKVPFDIRHEFDLDEHGLPTLIASGTVKRVGQHHLWARL